MNFAHARLIARTELLRYWRRGGKSALLVSAGVFLAVVGTGWFIDHTIKADTKDHPAASMAPGERVAGTVVLTGGDCRFLRESPRFRVVHEPGRKTPPRSGEMLLELPATFEETLGGDMPPRLIRTAMREDLVEEELEHAVFERLRTERLSRLLPGVDEARLKIFQSTLFDIEWREIGASSTMLRAGLVLPYLYCLMMLMGVILDVGVRDKTTGGLRHLLLTGIPGVEILIGKVLALMAVVLATLLTSVVGVAGAYSIGHALAEFSGDLSVWRIVVFLLSAFLGMLTLILGVMGAVYATANAQAARILSLVMSTAGPVLGMVALMANGPTMSLLLLPVPLAGTFGVGIDWLAGAASHLRMLALLTVQGVSLALFFRLAVKGVCHEERAARVGPVQRV